MTVAPERLSVYFVPAGGPSKVMTGEYVDVPEVYDPALGYDYDGPYDSVGWTPITDYVRWSDGVSLSRGRARHDATVSAGSLKLTLNNNDGRFSPGYSGGQYHPLKLRTPIQVRYMRQNVTYDVSADYDIDEEYDTTEAQAPIWTGTVDEWELGWRGPKPVVNIEATDMVAHCNRTKMDALPAQRVLNEDPVWLYPLDESEGTVASDRTGNVDAPGLDQTRVGVTGSPTAEWDGYSPGTLGETAEATVLVLNPADTSNYYYLLGSNVPAIADADSGSTLHCNLLPLTTSPSYDGWVMRFEDAVSGRAVGFGQDTSGVLFYWDSVNDSATLGSTTVSAADWSHVAMTQSYDEGTDTTTMTLYLNGVVESSALSWSGRPIGQNAGTLRVGATATTEPLEGNVCNVTAHREALSAATLAEMAAGQDGWDGDYTITRFYRIARAAGLSDSTDTGGGTAMSSQQTKDQSAAQAFQACADAEAAPWWVDGYGQLQMNTRDARRSASAVFSADAKAVSQTTTFSLSDALLVNHVTGTRPGGADKITRKDDASIAAYGEYKTELTAYVTSDTDLAALTELYAYWDAEPVARSENVMIDLVTKAASIDVDAVATLNTGDKFTITGLPATAPATSLDFFVEGTSDKVTRQGWERRINVSRGDRWFGWLLDTDLLGTGTILGY